MEETISFNPHDSRLIGVVLNDLYFKSEHEDFIIIVNQKEYFKLLKLYIKRKKEYCKFSGHFCGVFGEFTVDEYEVIEKGFVINDKTYPLYRAIDFDYMCDMEHG